MKGGIAIMLPKGRPEGTAQGDPEKFIIIALVLILGGAGERGWTLIEE
jgi:hypothetical protein